MKNQNPFFNILSVLLFLTISNFSWASSISEFPIILLEDRFSINTNHPYFEAFKKVAAKNGIQHIYYANLACAGNTRQEIDWPMVTNEGDKNSLIFTLQFEDRIEYDTLQNCVHINDSSKGIIGSIRSWVADWFDEDWGYENTVHSIKGKLPAIVETTWVTQIDRQKSTPMGIKLTEEAEVEIAIKTLEGQLVKTVHKGALSKGVHEFVWPHRNVSKGNYLLEYTVNGQSKRQEIRVKRVNHSTEKTDGCAALLRAVKKGKIDQVKSLLRKNNPNCSYYEEGEPRSSLNAAARKGNIEMGQLLLSAGAKIGYRSKGDEGALIGAAKYGHLAFVKLLLENGADVNQKVPGDGTPLINAIRRGHYEVTKYLLEQGADIYIEVSGDENPVYHASKQGKKMLDLVLEYR